MKTTVATSTGANPTEAHTIRGVVLDAVQRLDVRNVPAPEPAPGEAIVRLRAAALNHRDVWIKQGQYAGLKFPIIPGSTGAGGGPASGPAVAPDWAGRTGTPRRLPPAGRLDRLSRAVQPRPTPSRGKGAHHRCRRRCRPLRAPVRRRPR